MANESIYDLRRPGFPKQSDDGKSLRTTIEYVGLESDLRDALPGRGSSWGEYPGIIDSAEIEPLEATDYAILAMTISRQLDQTFEMSGTKRETTYEIDWVTIARPLMEHPEFNFNGAFFLTENDRLAIERWIETEDEYEKGNYRFKRISGGFSNLSDNAKKYAQGIILGIEYFNFKSPVLRMTEAYVNGPPPIATAGKKEDPPSSFPRKPLYYEWIKEADRSTKAGKNNRWERTQEWIGVKKVLIDSEGIFWGAADLI